MYSNPNVNLLATSPEIAVELPIAAGTIAVGEYVTPGVVAEVSTEVATLGSFDGNAQDETGWKT